MRTFIIVIVAILIISTMICGAVLLVLKDDFKDGSIAFNIEGFKDFSFEAGNYETYEINESITVTAQGITSIISNSVVADIEIVKWDKDEIQATLIGEISTRGGKPYLKKTESGSKVTMEVQYPKTLNISTFSSNLKLYIYVPENYEESFTLHTVSGNISIDQFDTTEEINLHTVSGEFFIDTVKGNKLYLSSVSGDGEIEQVYFNSFTFSSTSGSLEFIGNPGRLIADTVSGDVDLTLYGDLKDIDIDTVSGDTTISFDNDISATVELDSVTGKYNASMPISIISSSKNDIIFVIGENPNVKIEMSSVSGDLSVSIN